VKKGATLSAAVPADRKIEEKTNKGGWQGTICPTGAACFKRFHFKNEQM